MADCKHRAFRDVMRYILTIVCVLLFIGQCEGSCEQGGNCILPNCRCYSESSPNGLSRQETTQFVVFVFDSSVSIENYKFYDQIFQPEFRNPNGCPVSSTWFVLDEGTDYNYVKRLYERGVEIGVHGLKNSPLQSYLKNISHSDMRREIVDQKENLISNANILENDIHGWRSPSLYSSGDVQFEILQNESFEYDSSLMITRLQSDFRSPWPITLDYEWNITCDVGVCPEKRYPGLWEFPVVPLFDFQAATPCAGHVDSCSSVSRPSQAHRLFRDNFYHMYNNTKSPLIVNIGDIWLRRDGFIEAIKRFLLELLNLPDVYIVSMHQLVSWVKRPIVDWSTTNCSSQLPRANYSIPTGNYIIRPTVGAPNVSPVTRERCTISNCHLPDCRCSYANSSSNMIPQDVPQMVLLNFDGTVNPRSASILQGLLRRRKNPNGCDVSMTVFVHDKDCDYGEVRRLYDSGIEIAANSVSRQETLDARRFWKDMSFKRLTTEILQQSLNIHKLAGVPLEEIRGWRTPNLQPSEEQYSLLLLGRYQYDSTLTTTRRKLTDASPWPFTLDYGWDMACEAPPCPQGQYAGLWEVPVVSLVNRTRGDSCNGAYLDSCQAGNETDAFNLIMDNFNSMYNGSRAPFIINMQMLWLESAYKLRAVDRFLNTINNLRDVYIISTYQALEWIRHPTPLSQIQEFQPWDCVKLSSPPPHPTTTTTTTTTTTPATTTTIQPRPTTGCPTIVADTTTNTKEPVIVKIFKPRPVASTNGSRFISTNSVFFTVFITLVIVLECPIPV